MLLIARSCRRRFRFLSDDLHLHLSLISINITDSILFKNLAIIPFQFTAQEILASPAALQENVGLAPILVDKAADRVCFMFSNVTKELNAALDFHYHVPAPLKVHQDLYDTVEKLSLHATRPLGMPAASAAYQQDEVDLIVTTYAQDLSSVNSVKSISSLLKRYQLSAAFSSFFWTAPATVDFFSINTPPFKLLSDDDTTASGTPPPSSSSTSKVNDLTRSQIWGSLANIIDQSAQVSDLAVTDPCEFGTYPATQVSGQIQIPVSHLLNHDNPNFGGACLAFAIASLAQGPAFHMSLSSRPALLNYRSRSIEQSGSPGLSYSNAPYSAAGLLGTGQIVGIADTGVDSGSCYFYDSSGRVTPVSTNTNPAPFDLTKRKIVQYVYLAGTGDTGDTAGGHGTHTAGTVAGSNYQSSDLTQGGRYNGVAPNAKLAVMDLSSSGGIGVPNAASLIMPGYNAGARVFTYSWGSFWPLGTVGTYQTADMDNFVYNHKVSNDK